MSGEWTRRKVLGLAGASAAGSLGVGLGGCRPLATGQLEVLRVTAEDSRGFVSRPDLTPPAFSVRRFGPAADSRHIFLNAPYSGPGGGGAMILDRDGELVWFGPNTATKHKMDVNVQTYRGEQVLTWWQGISVQGFGQGEVAIADSSYRVRHVIQAHHGLLADLHEFTITPQGTALITAYRTHSGVDLSAVGGPSPGYVLSGVVQEIDIATGRLLFEWDSFDPAGQRVGVTETCQQIQPGDGTGLQPFNYMHINSIAQDADGDLLVSGRNTWAVYKVRKSDGAIIWRMNGKKSDFTMGPGAKFFWQHHVRPHGHGTLTVFDNGSKPPKEKASRALILSVDTAAMHVTLRQAYIHPAGVLAGTMGSAQILPGGRMLVGYGNQHRFAEFSADGTLLLDGKLGSASPSYRTFAKPWEGHPAERPAAAARHRHGGATVYASWNGATQVRSWTVLAGQTETSLSPIGRARRSGFETAILVSDPGPFFAVQANDSAGTALSTSRPVRIV